MDVLYIQRAPSHLHCEPYHFSLVHCHYHVPLQMVKRPNVDPTHHGPHEHDLLHVLRTAFPSVSNLRFYSHLTKSASQYPQTVTGKQKATGTARTRKTAYSSTQRRVSSTSAITKNPEQAPMYWVPVTSSSSLDTGPPGRGSPARRKERRL